MEHGRILKRETREVIDAGSPAADWHSPELADVAAQVRDNPELNAASLRLQAIDRAVTSAIEQVPVPVGLAERLLARLRADANAPPSADQLLPAEADALPRSGGLEQPAGMDGPKTAGWRPSRRRLMEAAALVALAAAVAILVNSWNSQPPRTWDLEAVLHEARILFDSDESVGWHALATASPPKNFPSQVAWTAGVRWRKTTGFMSRPVSAYELSRRGESRAVLYVVALDPAGTPPIADVPSAPTDRPMTTLGKTAAAWKSQDRLYVLVVTGGPDVYQSFIRRSTFA